MDIQHALRIAIGLFGLLSTCHALGQVISNLSETGTHDLDFTQTYTQTFTTGNVGPENGWDLTSVTFKLEVTSVHATKPTIQVKITNESGTEIGTLDSDVIGGGNWPAFGQWRNIVNHVRDPQNTAWTGTVNASGKVRLPSIETKYNIVWSMSSNPGNVVASLGQTGSTTVDRGGNTQFWNINGCTGCGSSKRLQISISASNAPDSAPTFSSATINGTLLIVSFSKAVWGRPSTSHFTVKVNGTATTVSSVEAKSTASVPSTKVELTLESGVDYDDTVTVSYSGSSLRTGGIGGTPASTFTDKSVTNNTPRPACPTGATGTYPDCTCPTGQDYDLSTNTCNIPAPPPIQCPAEASGTHPNCICPTGKRYRRNENSCEDIPSDPPDDPPDDPPPTDPPPTNPPDDEDPPSCDDGEHEHDNLGCHDENEEHEDTNPDPEPPPPPPPPPPREPSEPLTLIIKGETVQESAGIATFEVKLDRLSDFDTVIQYETVDGSAVAGEDYEHTSGEITIPWGTIAYGNIQVSIVDDDMYETDEEFSLEISVSDNVDNVSRTSATIVNDDTVPSVSIADAEAVEGGNIVIVISLSAPSTLESSVKYTYEDRTANAGTDYYRLSLTAGFQPGETVYERSLRIHDDEEEEGIETFVIKLYDPMNVTIEKGVGVMTILDMVERGDTDNDTKDDDEMEDETSKSVSSERTWKLVVGRIDNG